MRPPLYALVLLGSGFVLFGCKGDSQEGPSSPRGPTAASPASSKGPTSSLENPKRYLIHVESPQKVAVGQKPPAKATIMVQATGEFHVNKEFPLEVKVTAPEAELPKPTLSKDDATFLDERRVTFDIPFSAATVGEKKFSASLRFAVCTDKDCYPMRDTIAWAVEIVPPGQAAQAGQAGSKAPDSAAGAHANGRGTAETTRKAATK